MLFNNKPKQLFRKEQLSPLAVDHFVEHYPSSQGSFQYVLQSGKIVPFNAAQIFNTNGAREHFAYLLGQTYPYHDSNMLKKFPISQLAFVLDENKKTIPWTTNPKVLSQFITIAQLLGYLELQKDENNNLFFHTVPSVKPIIHKERTHTDD